MSYIKYQHFIIFRINSVIQLPFNHSNRNNKMKNYLFLLFAVLAVLIKVNPSDSAKILGFFSTPSPSHMIFHNALIYELANRGHEVTPFFWANFTLRLKLKSAIPHGIRRSHW